MYKTKDEGNTSLAIGLLRDFIENRAANMALRQLLDAACETERNTDGIWRNITARDRDECFDILEELLSQVRAQIEVVQSDLKYVHEQTLLQSGQLQCLATEQAKPKSKQPAQVAWATFAASSVAAAL